MEKYKYFVNKECEHYPCHKGVPEGEWSCLFCYCPWFWSCGSKGNNGELCIACNMPHYRDRWELIQTGLKNMYVSESGKGS
jgi:Zn-finger protein